MSIEDIRARLNATRHRHGEVVRYDDCDDINYQITIGVGEHACIWNSGDGIVFQMADHKATAELLANAPSDIAYLLAEVERLTEERDTLRLATSTKYLLRILYDHGADSDDFEHASFYWSEADNPNLPSVEDAYGSSK